MDPFPGSRPLRLDPVTGERVIVSDSTQGSGPYLGDTPFGVAWHPSGNLVVTNWIGGSVMWVDPRTGDRALLADGFLEANGVVVIVPEPSTLALAAMGIAAVLGVAVRRRRRVSEPA